MLNAIGNNTSVGVIKEHEVPSGPANTMVLGLRSVPKDPKDDMVIMDLTIPTPVRISYSVAMATAAGLISGCHKPSDREWEETFESLGKEKINHTLALYSLSKVDAYGEISLDSESGAIHIRFPRENCKEHVDNTLRKLKEISKILGGRLVTSLPWTEYQDILTVHPSGGCCMGSTGVDGVVNHKGQVFIDSTTDVHNGLYVVDGSVIPCALGISPAFTITALAERCLRILAEDAEWNIDFSLAKDIPQAGEENFLAKKIKPGISFNEMLMGDFSLSGKIEKYRCSCMLIVESEDVQNMLETDKEHKATVSGTLTCSCLSTSPLTASKGCFKIQSSEDRVKETNFIYTMVLRSEDNKQYFFHGHKELRSDGFTEIGIRDSTTLFVKIYEGENEKGNLIGEGTLSTKLSDFVKQLRTITVTNTESSIERMKWKFAFGKFFASSLWHTYSSLSSGSLLDNNAPPREKRSSFSSSYPN